MMFLQFAIWGAWAPVLAAYLLGPMKLSGKQTGWVYATLWLACIVSPFIGGQIADRWVATEYFLAAVHLAGGVLLLIAARQRSFWGIFVLMGLYSLLYAPTLALVNSLMLSHLTDPDAQAGGIRVWGTLGWIIAGWGLTGWRRFGKDLEKTSDSLLIAGVLSLVMGGYCLFLPHTPPPDQPGNPLAFLEALKMLSEPSFLVFLVISFVVTTELQFYYVPTAPFLEDIGVKNHNVPAVMTIAQLCEIVGMAILLPLGLKHLGIVWVLVLGVVAWPLRYIIFAIMRPIWLVIASLGFHGIGYTFFFFAGQIFVDKVAPPDIRGSAQALIVVVTLGLGNFIGTQFTGIILDVFKTPEGKFRWRPIFLIPCVLTIACAVAFILFFHPEMPVTEAEPAAAVEEIVETPAPVEEAAPAVEEPAIEEAATVEPDAAASVSPAQQAVIDQVREQGLKLKAAFEAQDIEAVVALFADDAVGIDNTDKAGIEEFLTQAKDMGYLEDLEVDVAETEFTVEPDKVLVCPVTLYGAFGSITLDLTFAPRAGDWKIIAIEQSGG